MGVQVDKACVKVLTLSRSYSATYGGKRRRIRMGLPDILSNVTIEPAYFVYFLAMTMAASGTGFMYPVKVCLEDFGGYPWYKDALAMVQTEQYPEGIPFRRDVEQRIVCLKLEANNYLDIVQNFRNTSENPLIDEVQQRVSLISAIALFMQFLPASLSTLIMLNAADMIGRKKLFILPLIGYLIYNLSFLLNWYVDGSSWWLVCEAVHECLGGRHVITIAGALYITDISNVENRTKRINILGLLELFGSGVGTFLGGFILDAKNKIGSPGPDPTLETEEFVYNGFLSLYLTASILTIGCILYIILFVKEIQERKTTKASISDIFSTQAIKKSLNCVFHNKKEGSRNVILILCVSYFFMAAHYGGTYLGGSLWLYFQKLSWDYSEFTTLLGVNAGTIFIGCTTIIPILIVKYKMADMTLAILATVTNIAICTLMFSTPYNNHWMPYVGTVFQLFTGIVGTTIKSTMTKIVEPDEVSHVMAFLGMTMPFSIFGPPVFNLIYRASLSFSACKDVETDRKNWCSGTFIIVGISFLTINLILFSYVKRYTNRNK